MAAQVSDVGFGWGRFLADSAQGCLVSLELSFNFRAAPLGFAVAGTYADGSPQGFK